MIGRALRAAQRVRLAWWRLTGWRPAGVHGIVFTPDDRLVLVRLRYADGWQLPGGGRGRRESAEDGLLRELREEIGLSAWRSVAPARGRGRDGPGEANTSLFVVRDATYRPRWSLEIAEVRAFDPAMLPLDLAPWAAAMLAWTDR